MRIPSRRSTDFSMAASRASVSRLPSPASIRRRVRSVSSNVRLPELPEARMDTRNPIGFPQPKQIGFQNHSPNVEAQQAQSIQLATKFSVGVKKNEAASAGQPHTIQREAIHWTQHCG